MYQIKPLNLLYTGYILEKIIHIYVLWDSLANSMK
jgi:hypothetical protein